MNAITLSDIIKKSVVVHTVTYFVIGVSSFLVFNYPENYSNSVIATFMRPLNHPLVTGGTLFQILRGALFGLIFYALRDVYFEREKGWLTIWLMLVIVGIFSTFGAAPSSIEGMVYTTLPMWFHIMSLPELIIQSGLLAFLIQYWVRHPEKRWIKRTLFTIFTIIVTITSLGVMSTYITVPNANL